MLTAGGESDFEVLEIDHGVLSVGTFCRDFCFGGQRPSLGVGVTAGGEDCKNIFTASVRPRTWSFS